MERRGEEREGKGRVRDKEKNYQYIIIYLIIVYYLILLHCYNIFFSFLYAPYYIPRERREDGHVVTCDYFTT